MKNIIIVIILITILLPCKAQTLQAKYAQIELMDGSTKKAVLQGCTADGIIVNRIANNSTNGKMDTLSYINIERIKVRKIEHPTIFTITLPIVGLIVGGLMGHVNEPAPTPNSIIDLSGLTTMMAACTGACIGGGVGALVDMSRRNLVYIIHGSESNFKEFVKIYKSEKVINEKLEE